MEPHHMNILSLFSFILILTLPLTVVFSFSHSYSHSHSSLFSQLSFSPFLIILLEITLVHKTPVAWFTKIFGSYLKCKPLLKVVTGLHIQTKDECTVIRVILLILPDG